MENDLVSVIIPMYNSEKYIAQTIESVQAQTIKNWEIIIEDDRSTDQSAEIVDSYRKRDGRIFYYLEDKKSGVAKARNDAIYHAKGRYLAFLDSDDLWCPEKLERQLQLMLKTGASFVYSACEVIDEAGNKTGQIRRVPEQLDYNKLLHGNVIPCLTVMLDREVIGEFRMPQMGHEDYATWLTILKKIPEAYGINEPLAMYRVNRQSVSANKFRAIKWVWNVYRKNQKLPVYESLWYLTGHILQALRKRKGNTYRKR